MATELIGIELTLRGEEGVYEDLRRLDSLLRSLGGRKVIQVELGKSKQRLLELKGAIEEAQAAINGTGDRGGKSVKEWKASLKQLQDDYKKTAMRANELSTVLKSHKSFGQMYKTVSTNIRHAGQNLQTLGNTLTKLGSPMRRLLSGTVFGAGYKLLDLMSEGFSRATQRADILSTYKPVFKAMGAGLDTTTDAWQSQLQTAYDKVYDSVVGLPTGIDEIVNEWKLLTIATQDYSKAADLAIASNNAILASGADEAAQATSRRELRTLLTTGKLTERQWDSLRKGIPVAWNAIEQNLKKSGEIEGSLLEALKGQEITAQEFGDMLIEEGISGKTKDVVNEMLHTYNAATANITNAFSNMGKNILATLDEILLGATGKDTIDYLIGMKGVIGSFSEGVQKWLRDNQDALLKFMDAIKNFDYKGFFEGVGNGLRDTLDALTEISTHLSGKGMSRLGYFLTVAAPLGRAITLFGGLLKGLSGPLSLLFTTIWRASMLKGAKGGIFEGIKTLLFGKGKDAGDFVADADKMAGTAPKLGKFASGLSSMFKGWAEIASMVGGTALVGWGTFKAFKSMFNDLKDIVAITKEIDWSVASADLVAMGGFIATFIGVGTKVGSAIGLSGLKGGAIFAGLTALFAGTFWADMAMIKRGFKAISDAVGYIKKAEDTIDELNSISNVPQLKKNIQQAVAVFNSLTDILQISRNNPVTGESTSGLKELDSASASTVKNIASTIKNIKAAVEDLNTLNGVSINTDNLLNIFGRLQHGLNMLGEVLVNMPSVFKDNTASGWASNMSGTVGNIRSSLEGIVGENGILAMIPEIINRMEGLDQSGKLLQLPGKMQKLGDALTSVYTSLQGIGAGEYFASNIDSFREGIKSLKFAIKHLQEIGSMEVGGDIVGKIQGIINNIQAAFDASKIAEIQSTIIVFASAIKIALATFESLNGDIEVDVTLKLSQNFYTSKQNVINEINNGRAEVKRACKPVSATIRVSVFFSVISNFASALGRITSERQALQRASGGGNVITVGPGQSTGGLRTRSGVLYRSKGGSIFRPRGTDKIPSMLTEGEYVQRKQAVDFFGLDFMRSVNNMDVRGAMEALLTKAGTSVGVGRQSIFNNTVNNNQKVVQNINTNNPNFAGVQMGRFVGAL